MHCKTLIYHPDYDPEADGFANDSGSDASDDEDQRAGTEHYESVGKSKLRQKDSISLGPQYRGSKVSRAALEEESEGEEDDEDEDDAAQDDDETREHSGDETQDALEGRIGADEHDEALDGDESD
jgi:protein AATF/BFR2